MHGSVNMLISVDGESEYDAWWAYKVKVQGGDALGTKAEGEHRSLILASMA